MWGNKATGYLLHVTAGYKHVIKPVYWSTSNIAHVMPMAICDAVTDAYKHIIQTVSGVTCDAACGVSGPLAICRSATAV